MRQLASTAVLARRPRGRLDRACPARQSGMVLVVSLMLLVVLTLLGLSSMNMTSLQEKMAANSQQSMAALQAAESALADGLDNPGAISPDCASPATIGDTIGSTGAQFSYQTVCNGTTPPPEGSLYSAEMFQAYHYTVVATGSTSAGATVVVNGGMYQIAPKGL